MSGCAQGGVGEAVLHLIKLAGHATATPALTELSPAGLASLLLVIHTLVSSFAIPTSIPMAQQLHVIVDPQPRSLVCAWLHNALTKAFPIPNPAGQ